jgi:hypothetical protein
VVHVAHLAAIDFSISGSFNSERIRACGQAHGIHGLRAFILRPCAGLFFDLLEGGDHAHHQFVADHVLLIQVDHGHALHPAQVIHGGQQPGAHGSGRSTWVASPVMTNLALAPCG